ncbi:MAG: ribbon-helix-helix domain-containing protein [Gammaproteobacteria bacterium]|nr:ribbon-helix-helix domain-containing protein [Gammaproteobacteria bacterium]
MNTISLKVPGSLALRLENEARQRGLSKSAVIRDALEEYLRTTSAENSGSALALAADLAGVLSGPEDLSFNKDHLHDFGR